MKLSVFNKRLNEDVTQINISKAFDASMLRDSKMLDQLANKIHSQGFPEKFSLATTLSTGDDLTLEYELYEKTINDSKVFHQVTFTYEYSRETTIKTRALLRQAEKNDDSDSYDILYDELENDMIHITADFGEKITKVRGSTK